MIRHRLYPIAVALGLLGVWATAAPAATLTALSENIPAESNICRGAITAAEKHYSLPFGILQAISLAESGRWEKKTRAKFAWPWTVTAHGTGKFYPSKRTAIAAVRALKAEGVRNIDVGCMQINLHYHPRAFETLEQAFEPAANVRYAARLFAKLRAANRSITRAVAHYHSTTRARNLPYKRKVMKLWNEERQRHYAAERERKQQEWLDRRDRLMAEKERQRRAWENRRARAGWSQNAAAGSPP